jgi:hypothetical protein
MPFVSAGAEISVPAYPARTMKPDSPARPAALPLSVAEQGDLLTGTGGGRIALVLFAASSGPGAVSLVLIGTVLPPLAGAVAGRVDQRRMLAGCQAGPGVSYAILAVTRPPLPALLPLVILASLLATSGARPGRAPSAAWCPRSAVARPARCSASR